MFPYIKILNKELSTYMICALIGILLCIFYVIKICKKKKLNDYYYVNLLLISLIGVLIGSHILYGIVNFDLILKFFTNLNKITSFKIFIDCIVEIFGGSIFYGGLIGALIISYICAKKIKINNEKTYDIMTPVIPLFHTFGRIGCFLGGCCYGIESPIGFKFTNALIDSANGVTRFPVQLVEALFNFILFLILFKFLQTEKFKGYLLNIYLIFYPIFRFVIEFFRGDEYRGFIFGLSTSQIISIILLIFSICNVIYRKKYHNKLNN